MPEPKPGVRYCPSAQPDMQGAVLIAVRESTDAACQIAYLEKTVAISDDLLAKVGPVEPTEVLRFAAPCEEMACRHFDGSNCRLATRIVQILPAVVDTLPRCTIRGTCRWYRQEGRPACLRCPQIITRVDNPSPELTLAATPD